MKISLIAKYMQKSDFLFSIRNWIANFAFNVRKSEKTSSRQNNMMHCLAQSVQSETVRNQEAFGSDLFARKLTSEL